MLKDLLTGLFAILNGLKILILVIKLMINNKFLHLSEGKGEIVDPKKEVATESDGEDHEEEEDEEEDEEKDVDGDCDKILSELVSSNCHVHKMNLCQTEYIKLLCDYLKSYPDETNKLTIANEINKSNYCSSFNKIINLYNDKTKCKDDNSNNEYCQKKPEIQSNELYVDVSDARPLERGTGSDSTTCEMQCITYIDESYKILSTSLTSCPYGSNKEPCVNSLQPPVVINGEKTYQLDQIIHEHTEDELNSHMNSKSTGSTSTTLTSASSVLGIPLLLFMLYKFTPLGSMVNNRKSKKDKWKTNEERYNQHLLYNTELRNINSNNIKYNIAYYSLINS
ncbi:PIR protein [Plasmodium ovale]|uniref:PIR protein n=1 Tax=Plasmodium ovale TaxID=36330 RepID=A0A1D3JFD0_PLAOA|nr:PIR protein [Plasmodium ovale]